MKVGLVTLQPQIAASLGKACDLAWVAPEPDQGADVVLVDLTLPRAEAVVRELAAAGIPVVVLGDAVEAAYDALGAGALDVLDPSIGPERIARRLRRFTAGSSAAGIPLLAIAASTGGPAALATILRDVPHRSLATLVAQHLDPQFADSLAELLSAETGARVKVAAEGDRPAPGVCLLARASAHLVLSRSGQLRYVEDPSQPHIPSGTLLFESLARHWPGRGAAVVLTGMGVDGARGLLALRNRGWATFAQDEASSAVWGMPKAAVAAGAAASVVPIERLGAAVARALARKSG